MEQRDEDHQHHVVIARHEVNQERVIRHDALGHWPEVEIDENTALPRDLTDDEIANAFRDPFKPGVEVFSIWKFRWWQMQCKIVRGCIALGITPDRFELTEDDKAIISTMGKDENCRQGYEDIRIRSHQLVSEILYRVLGVKYYLYFRKAEHVDEPLKRIVDGRPEFLRIDPRTLVNSVPHKDINIELHVTVKDFGYDVPYYYYYYCERKVQGFIQHRGRKDHLDISPIEYLADPMLSIVPPIQPSSSTPSTPRTDEALPI